MSRTRGSMVDSVLRVASALMLASLGACSIVGSSLDGFTGGAADCPAGAQRCGDLCVDLSSNPANCGACGRACGTGEACRSGICQVSCPGGQSECGGLCFQLSNDPRNCGACGKTCAAGEVCGDGKCSANCPNSQTNCGGSCADLQSDPKHCGTCEKSCGANEECNAGQCVIACRTQLNQAITDPWGWSWDGLERAASAWGQADTTCTAFRGRLPTATELYRVSATKSATVGQSIHTNFLWSQVPYGVGAHVQVRLSDANTSPVADATARNYRCVCPPPRPAAFTGNNCNGPVASPCYGLGTKYDLDAEDRAPLHKGGAIWECAQARGALASPVQITEAIRQGIGTGTGAWLHTSDDVRYDLDAVVSWNTPAGFQFRYTGAVNALSWSAMQTFYPFRCVGVNAVVTHPAAVPNEFVAPTGVKGETQDTAAVGYTAAIDACFARGGHLPTATELATLAAQGLPNGSNAMLWTSDQVGYNGTSFLVEQIKWDKVAPILYQNGVDTTWGYKHTGTPSLPYRCIFYPVDTTYTGPAAATCSGGCMQIPLGGTSGAKMWVDNADRAAMQGGPAIEACRAIGGRLTSERDLVEAVRKALPGGSNVNIYTSDLELGTANPADLLLGVGKWQAVATAYDDSYPTYTTWAYPYDAAGHPFRCMWTNELR